MTRTRIPLGKFVREYSVRNKEDEDIPVYSVTNSHGFCTEYFSKDVASQDKTTYKVVPRGYFAYNPSRINVGSVDWQKYEDRVIVSPLYNVFAVSDEVDRQYLYYFLRSHIGRQMIKAKASGSVRDNLKIEMLKEMTIPDISIQEQRFYASVLDKLQLLIGLKKEELQQLNDLVKARFVEMFGDPVYNPFGYEKVHLSELADIKIGPFGSLLHKDDYIKGGHPLINPSHIIDGKIVPDNKLTISSEKYKELSAYQLMVGDVVMGRRGEMGRCAVVLTEGLLCGTGSLLIRTNGKVTADYIQKTISFPSFKRIIEDMSVGQTMLNVNVSIVSKLQIIKPPLDVQNRYNVFVQQVDKSKVVIEKSIKELETLQASLMQKYFS